MIEDVNISFAKLVFNHLHNTELRRALAVILIDYQIPDEIFKELTGIRRKTAKQWKKKAKISGFEALKSKRVTDLSSSESESQIQGSQSRDFQVILENIQSCSNESNSIPSETCQSERENETIPENQDQDLVPDSALAVNKIYQELYESEIPNEISQFIEGESGWKIIGASRRGKYHTQLSGYREDSFGIMKLKGWHFVAVADGAGSARLARIGSQIAVNSAIKFFKNSINLAGPEFNLQTILFGCLKSVYCSLETEARTRQNTINELATTLLLLAHNPGEGVDKIGVAQIGDGLIIVCHPTGDVSLLADPDQGQYAGETQFITHISLEEMDTDFNSRIRIHEVPSEKIDYILLMTDGIGDDFFPPERNIQKLVTHLHPIIACDLDTAQTELSNLIAYEKRASFDDRTLVMLTRNPKPSN